MNSPNPIDRLSAASAERSLKWLMVASWLVPLAILTAFAWHAYVDAVSRAERRLEAALHIAHEHARKVIETDDLAVRRVFDLLQASGDAVPAEPALHARLAEMAAAIRDVEAIAVLDQSGRLIAHSNFHPSADASAGLANLRSLPSGALAIGDSGTGPLASGEYFTLLEAREQAGGGRRVVAIAVSPRYFTGFYQQLAAGERGMSLSLVRPDATVLTRYPDSPATGTRSGSHNPLISLITDTEPVRPSLAVSPEDGRRRYVVAQRLGNYPLFVSAELEQSAVIDEWLAAIALPALVALAAAIALFLATRMSLQKTRREHAAMAQLQQEARRRAAAEGMLAHLSQHLIRVSETEKAKLAAELHDELGGALSALALDLAWVLERLKKTAPDLVDRQNQAIKLVHDTAALKRRIIDGLRPMLLQHLGLAPALRDYATQWSKKSGVPVALRIASESPAIPSDAALALFRVVQESLTNVAKYANARHVVVALTHDDQEVGVTIEDDGIGFAPEILLHPTSHGLTGMQQRVAPFGGTFTVTSAPGAGTRISARIPARATADDEAETSLSAGA